MEKVIVYTDGGSRGNPGPSGIGIVIRNDSGKVIKEYGEFLGPRFTNNEAEYQAVIFALKKIKALFGKGKIRALEIEINSDSELLVKQLQGKYKILNANIQPLFLTVWNAKLDFGKVEFKHIPREQNKQADKLVNQALDAQTVKMDSF
ncbi:ribonuclease HI family protein [Candidatus Parcubacteria bacterium]|jgi:ribonuclease HI|nr:ribonuclease HI family protein [Candidatus Parcubacteria bacterium]